MNQRMGIQRQIEDGESICEWNNYEIYKCYVDNDISAYGASKGATKKRPDFDNIIKDYKSGKIDIIVVSLIDRLSRDLLSFEEALQELSELDVLLCSLDLGMQELNLSDPEDRTRAQQAVTNAQFESARKSKRLKRANLQRAKMGIMRKGSRLFGYDLNNNIVPEEAEIVRAIYKAYAKGSSIGAITRAIAGHDDGTLPNIPTSEAPSVIFLHEKEERDIQKGFNPEERGEAYLKYREKVLKREWSRSTTASILRNPRYAGFVYHAPVKRDGTSQSYNSDWAKFIVRDKNTGEYLKGDWEPIIDLDTWWAVQSRRDRNLVRSDGTAVDKSGWPKKHLGAGLYRCCVCGKPMKTGGTGGNRNKSYYTYRCDGHVNRMGQKIDEHVLATIRLFLERDDFKTLLVQPVDNSKRLSEIEEELQEVNNLINQTKKTFIEERDNFDADFIDLINDRLNSLKVQRAKLEEEQIKLSPEISLGGIFDAPNPAEAFDAITDIAQKSRIVDFLCTVTLKPNERGKRTTPEALAENVIIEWKQHDLRS